ncbi:hypothetical protein F1880_001753 [Penicillium rolfsii]|nr:hypothetical protein F1880_001753 [Penicillium rolfsii]
MSETMLQASSVQFQNGQTYSLHVPGGGALSIVPGKYLPQEVHIRPWEHALNQLWHAEANNDGFGFRNASTGKLLGVNKNGDIACVATELNDWERFMFEDGDSGTIFYVIYKGDQQYLYRPDEWDSLQVTEHKSSAIQMEVQQE